jgi:hypothetical protein
MDESIFEIEDYTNATEYESFIKSLEQAFQNPSETKTTKKFQSYNFEIKHHNQPLIKQLPGSEFSLQSTSSLQKYYNLTNYITVTCTNKILNTEPEIAQIKSAVRTALTSSSLSSNTETPENSEGSESPENSNQETSKLENSKSTQNCAIKCPVLIKICDNSRDMWTGTFKLQPPIGAAHCDFDVLQLTRPPNTYHHLSGLKRVFLSKLGHVPDSEIYASARLTYRIEKFKDSIYTNHGSISRGAPDDLPIYELIPGVKRDPVSSVILNCDWNRINIDLLYDSGNHSDLEPTEAPVWGIKLGVDYSETNLGGVISSFISLANSRWSKLKPYSVENGDHEESMTNSLKNARNENNPLDRLGGVKASDGKTLNTLSKMVDKTQDFSSTATGFLSSAAQFLRDGPEPLMLKQNPLSPDVVNHAIEFVFSEPVYFENQNSKYLPNSAPNHSLSMKLSLVFSILNEEHGAAAIRQIWEGLIEVLEQRFACSIYLPGTDTLEESDIYGEISVPKKIDWNASLLQQKLDMINLCVASKRRREFINSQKFELSSELEIPDTPEQVESRKVSREASRNVSRKVSCEDNIDEIVAKEAEFKEISEALEKKVRTESLDEVVEEIVNSDSDDDFYDCDEESEQKKSTETEEIPDKVLEIEDTSEKVVEIEEISKNVDSDPESERIEAQDSKTLDFSKKISLLKSDYIIEALENDAQTNPFLRNGQVHHEESKTPLFLLDHPEIPLYIPHTQIGSPQTSDELDEFTRKIREEIEADTVNQDSFHSSQLNESDPAISTKVQAQHDAKNLLKSDVAAFKAANPRGGLKDFVRWHSPRDFDHEKGELSSRMKANDNDWNEIWESILPKPAYLQKRLFDETVKALGVINELKDWNFERLFKGVEGCLASQVAEKIGFDVDSSGNDGILLNNDLLDACRKFEHAKGLESSLDKKFTRHGIQVPEKFVEGEEVVIPGAAKSDFGRQLLTYLKINTPNGREVLDYHVGYELPFSREFILQVDAKYPNKHRSRSFAQRMYVRFAENEFRLAGAFTSDDTFL